MIDRSSAKEFSKKVDVFLTSLPRGVGAGENRLDYMKSRFNDILESGSELIESSSQIENNILENIGKISSGLKIENSKVMERNLKNLSKSASNEKTSSPTNTQVFTLLLRCLNFMVSYAKSQFERRQEVAKRQQDLQKKIDDAGPIQDLKTKIGLKPNESLFSKKAAKNASGVAKSRFKSSLGLGSKDSLRSSKGMKGLGSLALGGLMHLGAAVTESPLLMMAASDYMSKRKGKIEDERRKQEEREQELVKKRVEAIKEYRKYKLDTDRSMMRPRVSGKPTSQPLIQRFGGGGSFVTSGREKIEVGDNPGGQELVTVTPLSGVGKTRIRPGGLAAAGGMTGIFGGNTESLLEESNETLKEILKSQQSFNAFQIDKVKDESLAKKTGQYGKTSFVDSKGRNPEEEKKEGGILSGIADKLGLTKGLGTTLMKGGIAAAGGLGAGYLGYKGGDWLAGKMGVEEGSNTEMAMKLGGGALAGTAGALGAWKLAGKFPGLSKVAGAAGMMGTPVYVTNADEIGGGGGAGLTDLIGGGKKGKSLKGIARLARMKGGSLFGSAAKMMPSLGKMGPGLTKGLGFAGRLAGKAALPLAAGMALYDGFKGWKNADEISGSEPGKANISQKTGAALSSVISGLTFGLISPKSIYKAGSDVVAGKGVMGKVFRATPLGALFGIKEGFGAKADEIAGTEPGKANFLQKTGAGLANAASGMTFGLIKPQTMYKAFEGMAQLSPAGMLFKGWKWFTDKEKKTEGANGNIAEKKKDEAPVTASEFDEANKSPLQKIGGFFNNAFRTAKEAIAPTTAGVGYEKSIRLSKPQAQANESALQKEAIKAGIKDPKELAMFMGQMSHESANFSAMKEFGSGARYEGRKDLGNTQQGDGERFKGRGFIQLTGRANYANYGKKIGVDLIKNPELAERPDIASKIAIAYWRDRGVDKAAQKGDILAATKKINGGLNGYQDRVNKYQAYLDKFQKNGITPATASKSSTEAYAAAAAVSAPAPAPPRPSGSGPSASSSAPKPYKPAQVNASSSELSGGGQKASGPSGGGDPIEMPTPQNVPKDKPVDSIKAGGGAHLDKMQKPVLANLNAMAMEYEAKTGKKLNISDGWRSSAVQADLYRRKPHLAAPPGRSMHEFGYATDMNSKQATELDNLGLLGKYGFTRPMWPGRPGGKKEEWHVEPTAIQGKYSQIRGGGAPSLNVGSSGGGGGSSSRSSVESTYAGSSPDTIKMEPKATAVPRISSAMASNVAADAASPADKVAIGAKAAFSASDNSEMVKSVSASERSAPDKLVAALKEGQNSGAPIEVNSSSSQSGSSSKEIYTGDNRNFPSLMMWRYA